MEFTIKQMSSQDSEEVNLLSRQFDYLLSLQQTLENITAVIQSKDHTAFVAVYENKIVGWVGAAYAIMIEVMPHCEKNSLVIDENQR
jgi:hypothetical protein